MSTPSLWAMQSDFLPESTVGNGVKSITVEKPEEHYPGRVIKVNINSAISHC